jgi:Pyruvate-formate lyase-activating enzyme
MFIPTQAADTSTLVSLFAFAPLSTVDGPGKRVVVFFQGCGIGCEWCHSPHAQPSAAPLLFHADRCLGCGRCAVVCPSGAQRVDADGHAVLRERCTACGACVEACPQSSRHSGGGALSLPERRVGVAALFRHACSHFDLADGITLSGGEALEQEEGAVDLLRFCRGAGVHTAVESSGLLAPEVYRRATSWVDCWLFGCRVVTARGQIPRTDRLERSLAAMRAGGGVVLPRLPAVPGVTDAGAVLRASADMLKRAGIRAVWLLPWNPHYDQYYRALGREPHYPAPTREEADGTLDIMHRFYESEGFDLMP